MINDVPNTDDTPKRGRKEEEEKKVFMSTEFQMDSESRGGSTSVTENKEGRRKSSCLILDLGVL